MWRCNANPDTNPHANADTNAIAQSHTRAKRDRLGGRFDTGRSRISFRWQRVELDCC